MTKAKHFLGLLLTISWLLPATAWAVPGVAFHVTAEKEMMIENDGKNVVKRVPATEIVPDEVIFYTIHYENQTSEVATNVVINDPIPDGTTYLAGSAFGKGATISFSADGGKTFKQPSMLIYEVQLEHEKVEKRQAMPEDYTHIRWTIDSLPPKRKGTLGFQVHVN